MRERRARPTSDLLARLVAAEVDGERLDDGELEWRVVLAVVLRGHRL